MALSLNLSFPTDLGEGIAGAERQFSNQTINDWAGAIRVGPGLEAWHDVL